MRLHIPYPVRCAAFALVLAASCFVLGRGAFELAESVSTAASTESAEKQTSRPSEKPLLVIDPGHGGEDGGASVAGISEKDINLAVSLRVGDLCAVFGLPVMLTRTTDTLLYDAYGDLED